MRRTKGDRRERACVGTSERTTVKISSRSDGVHKQDRLVLFGKGSNREKLHKGSGVQLNIAG